jgi:hypothetical protein
MFLTETLLHVSSWRKSSRSMSNGDCVEISAVCSKILVRDTKKPDGATLGYPLASWRLFVSSAKRGDFEVRKLSFRFF